MFNFFEQAIRADLRAFTGFLTLFIIINIVFIIGWVFFGKKIPKEYKTKLILALIIFDLATVILVPLSITKRYQEKLIPNQKINEKTIDDRMEQKRKKMGIE